MAHHPFQTPRKSYHGLFLVLIICLLASFHPATAQAQQEGTHSHKADDSAMDAPQKANSQLWTCSMHPQIQLPNPGKCPICGMDLIPLKKEATGSEDGGGSMRELKLSPYAEKLAEIEVTPVKRRFVEAKVPMVGKIEYDETRVVTITAWVPGRIDRLYVDFTGIWIKKGDPMVYLYSPDLITAQQELLQAIRTATQLNNSDLSSIKQTAGATIRAAKEKLHLWGLSKPQIDDVIKRGKPTDHMTILAPISGVVIHKDGMEGMYVKTGSRIYMIADLSKVWVRLDAYESDLMWVRLGQEVEFQTEAYPGQVFKGTVAFIDPFLNPKTRTAKVRLNVDNTDGKLKPELFVRAELRTILNADGKAAAKISDGETPPLVIPASAPLLTGKRAVVYVADPDRDGVYHGREIVLGPRAGDYYLVKTGLREGEKVVSRGAFKIDSAVQILAEPSMMTPEGAGAGGHHHGGSGVKKAEGEGSGDAMEIPPAFKEQLQEVVAAYNLITEDMKTEDLNAIRQGFSGLRRTLDQVDMTLASGHAHMVWMELAMLLENDAVVGTENSRLKEAKRNYQTLTWHVQRMKQQFELDHGTSAAHSVESLTEQVPASFRAEILNVLRTYLVAQHALSQDRFHQAKESLTGMRKAIQQVDMKQLSGSAHERWMSFFGNLNEALAQLDSAENLDVLRRCFAPLSEAMAMVVNTFGPLPGPPLYQMRCPMAFDGKGATWLQTDSEVRNPYYGPAMLGCGDVIRTFQPEAPTADKEHQHE